MICAGFWYDNFLLGRFCVGLGGRFLGATRLAWTEVGAECIGVIQSLLVTYRLQGIDPYAYLVDVLLRISIHPASQLLDVTPRRWKEKFAHRPMQSDLALADQ